MHKLTAAVLRHRVLVAAVWIALTVVGALFVGKANSGLTHQQATPGLAGYDANQAMIRYLGLDGVQAPVIAVLPLPGGQSMSTAAGRRAAARTFGSAGAKGHVGLIDFASSHDRRRSPTAAGAPSPSTTCPTRTTGRTSALRTRSRRRSSTRCRRGRASP